MLAGPRWPADALTTTVFSTFVDEESGAGDELVREEGPVLVLESRLQPERPGRGVDLVVEGREFSGGEFAFGNPGRRR